jgi:hypothetical protein
LDVKITLAQPFRLHSGFRLAFIEKNVWFSA